MDDDEFDDDFDDDCDCWTWLEVAPLYIKMPPGGFFIPPTSVANAEAVDLIDAGEYPAMPCGAD